MTISNTITPFRESSIFPTEQLQKTTFLEVTTPSLESLQLVVVRCPKTEPKSFDSKGGRYQSVLDDGIMLTVPRDAFQSPTEVAMKVICLVQCTRTLSSCRPTTVHTPEQGSGYLIKEKGPCVHVRRGTKGFAIKQ